MATIDNLTLEITANSTSAVNSLDKLSTALGKLKTNLPTQAKLESSAKGFKALKDEISKLSLSAKNLDRIKAIGQIGNALSKISSVSPANIKKNADNLDALQGAISHISDSGVERIERLASAFQKLAKANRNMGGLGSTRRIANALAQSNTPIGTTPANNDIISETGGNASGTISNAKTAISLFATLRTIGQQLTPVLNLVGKGFNAIGGIVKKITAPIRGFVKSLARIAFYRFIRSVLKSITQGLQEGIQNLALYSKALNELDAHRANNVMSRYASEFLYFKNAVATAVIPILRELIPYVETAINTVIKFVDVLAQVGSAIFGTEYTKAKYFWVDYADSLDNANGRAKALKHQLAGFDELNNLTANSGGSGSDKLEDARQMFEESLIDPKILSFVDNIKSKLTGAFERIKTITKPFFDRIKEMSAEIKQKVYPNIKRIYDNVKKIWTEFLRPIAEEFLKGFFEGFTGEAFKSLPDTLEKITDKVADFTDWLVKLKDKVPVDKVKDFAFNLGDVLGKITGFYKPYTWIVNASDNVKKILTTLYEKTKNMSDALANLIVKTFDLQNPTSFLSTKIEDLKNKIENAKKFMSLMVDVAQSLYDKFINLENPSSVLSTKLNDIKDKANNLWNKLKDLGDKLLDTSGKFTDTKDKANKFWEILSNVSSKADDVKTALSNIKAFLERNNPFKKGEEDATPLKNVLEKIKDFVDYLEKIGTITIDFIVQATGFKKAGEKIGEFLDSVGGNGDEVRDKTEGIEDVGGSRGNTSEHESPKDGKQLTSHQKREQKIKDGKVLIPSDFDNLEEYLVYSRTGAYAKGGFPTQGGLFIANEAGAEMVGSINGRTAVANNDQITEAIAQATYNAMTKALAENGGSVNIVVEGDGEKMFKVFQKKQREYQRKTGLAY